MDAGNENPHFRGWDIFVLNLEAFLEMVSMTERDGRSRLDTLVRKFIWRSYQGISACDGRIWFERDNRSKIRWR